MRLLISLWNVPLYLAQSARDCNRGILFSLDRYRETDVARSLYFRSHELERSVTPLSNDPIKLACSTTCLPGSEAERKEMARIAEFQRAKSERLAQELRDKPERDARRNEEYEASMEANRMLMRKKRTT